MTLLFVLRFTFGWYFFAYYTCARLVKCICILYIHLTLITGKFCLLIIHSRSVFDHWLPKCQSTIIYVYNDYFIITVVHVVIRSFHHSQLTCCSASAAILDGAGAPSLRSLQYCTLLPFADTKATSYVLLIIFTSSVVCPFSPLHASCMHQHILEFFISCAVSIIMGNCKNDLLLVCNCFFMSTVLPIARACDLSKGILIYCLYVISPSLIR
jgi:hypothetical protein